MKNHLIMPQTVNPQTGLVEPVQFRPSPFFDARPVDTLIDMIVIHGISLPPGEFGGNDIEAFFCGKLNTSRHPFYASIAHLNVSAHLLIKRCGEMVQFVPFHARAWHAGESSFYGRTRCNDFSIGIELEGTDTIRYEQQQYDQLGKTIRLLMQAYPTIAHNRIVGHAEIAPGRKTDPGPVFDWEYLKGKLA
jgi:N-acetyl-anhydromuramoyl-L-alanine amidase